MREPLTEAVVDLAVLQDNVRALVAAVAPAALMVVVKDDAFGHGLLPVARTALDAGASWLGVLDVPTALRLRTAGVRAPLLAWLHPDGEDFHAAVEARVDLGVASLQQLAAIGAAAAGLRTAVLHLEVDTGMGRGGATAADWPALVAAAVRLERRGRARVRGVWSHLAGTSPSEDLAALDRLRGAAAQAEALGAHPDLLHLAASAAALGLPETRLDLVRIGLAVYGVSPFSERTAASLGLAPALALTTTVVADGPEPRLLRIGAGWAQGLHPCAASRAEVAIAGRRHRVVDIGPDVTTVLRSPADGGPPPSSASPVTVFDGEDRGGPTAADWARWARTVPDEVLTRIPSSVPRRYLPPR